MSPTMVGQRRKFNKIALNGISFTFLSYWFGADLHIILEHFYRKRITWKNSVKNHLKIKLCGIPQTHKTIISALIKNLLIKPLLLPAAE